MRIRGALLALLIAGAAMSASGKRAAPKDVPPIVAAGVRYVVPHFGALHGVKQNGGYVQAWDVRSGKLLWDRMVYRIRYRKELERDAQDVFISGISVKGDKLFVEDERGERFEMDLKSGKVRALTQLAADIQLPDQRPIAPRDR